VFQKLTEAAIRAKTEGLDDLGLSIKDGATSAETLTNIMDGLRTKLAQVGDQAETSADKIQRIGVTWDNLKQDAKDFLAESFVGGGINYFSGMGQLNDLVMLKTAEIYQKVLDKKYQTGELQYPGSQINDFGEYVGPPPDFWKVESGGTGGTFDEASFLTAATKFQELLKRRLEAYKKAKKEAEEAAKEARLQARGRAMLRNGYTEAGAGPSEYSTSLGAAADNAPLEEFDIQRQIEQMGLALDQAQEQRKTSFLESTFGKLEDFDAYATAFQSLTGAVSAGLNAWIDGSASAGQAIKQFLSDALQGLATQMAVEALKHGAYALGSLAFGDVRGAGQHAAAAAAFTAAAAAAAVGARSLGSGGASTPASSGGRSLPNGGSTGSTSGVPEHSTINYIIVGDSYADDSPRKKQRKAERIVHVGMSHTSAGRAE
jgi:hypothetical protein